MHVPSVYPPAPENLDTLVVRGLTHTACKGGLVWKRHAPKDAADLNPGLGVWCTTCERFVDRAEWSQPDATPVAAK